MTKKKLVDILPVLLAVVLLTPLIPIHAQKQGGTLIYSAHDDPPTLNPAISTVDSVYLCVKDVFNSLVGVDTDWNIVPELAQSWTVSEDGLTWTFNLVQNATFHDGTPFTSADVKFTMENVTLPHHPRGTKVFDCIDHVETPDDYTAVFKLKYQYGPLLIALVRTFTVLPKHLYEGTDILENPYNFDPIGTGPFKFQEYAPGDHITLVRNENYWRAGKPYLDKLVIRIIPDEPTADAALLAGEVDYIPVYVMGVDVPEFEDNPDIEVSDIEGRASSAMYGLMFNNRPESICSDQKVRQAILYAIDRDEAIELVEFGMGIHTENQFSPGIAWCYNPDPDYKYTFDPDKANQLLDDAGYPKDGEGVRFHLKGVGGTWYYSYYKNVEFMIPYLEDVGIILDVERQERSVFNERVFTNYEFDLTVLLWTNGPDPNIGMSRYMTSDSIKGIPWTNVASYNNSRVDELFQLAQQEADQTKRKEYFYEIQDIMSDEVPMMGLYQKIMVSAWNKDLKGHPSSVDLLSTSEENTYWETISEEGLPIPLEWLIAIVAVVAVVIIAAVVLLRRKR